MCWPFWLCYSCFCSLHIFLFWFFYFMYMDWRWVTTIAHYFSCHRFRGRWVWFVRKSRLDAELIDVFWGSLVNREFRPFALKLCCFNLMCRWSTISFDSSSALTRLDSSWYIFLSIILFFWELPGVRCSVWFFYIISEKSVTLIASLLSILLFIWNMRKRPYILKFAICCLLLGM